MKKGLLQQARTYLNKVIKYLITKIIQYNATKNKTAAIFVSRKISEKSTQLKLSFSEFLRHSPLFASKIEIKRDKSLPREIDL